MAMKMGMWCCFKIMEFGRCGKRCIQCNNAENLSKSHAGWKRMLCWKFGCYLSWYAHDDNNNSILIASLIAFTLLVRNKKKKEKFKYLMKCWIIPKNSEKYQFDEAGFSRIQNFEKFCLNIFPTSMFFIRAEILSLHLIQLKVWKIFSFIFLGNIAAQAATG